MWGSPLDDLFATMCMYPWVCAQMTMQVDTDGKDMPTYFASTDEIQAQMKQNADASLPTTGDVEVKKQSSA